MAPQPTPVYEDFEVQTEWVHEALQDSLIAYLPGFKKDQLKVQVTTGGNLRIAGERPIGGNKFNRFYKEIPIPSNCNQNQIRANFSGGMLHIKHPRLIVPADEEPEQAKPSAQVPKFDQTPQPPRPADVPRKQTNGPEQAVQEAPPMASQPTPVYEDFEVQTEWVHEALQDSLIAYLPGFKKDQLKVQVTTGGNLRIAGERPIGGNKFSRFYKEIPIPSNCNQNQIRAKFSGGMLHIKHPKLIVPADEEPEQAKPSAQVPKSDQTPQPPRPADVPRKQTNGPEQAVQDAPPMATMEKQAGETTKLERSSC